jgi:hypothetical protein
MPGHDGAGGHSVSGAVSAAPPAVPAGGRAGIAGPAGSAGAVVLSMDAAAALAALGSLRRGLGEDEAARRRALAGPNALPRPRRRPVTAELAAQLANMFAVALMVAAGLTFLIYFLSSPRDTADLVLAFGILGVVVLNALIGFVQEHAAERTAEALQAMVPHAARVLRGGELAEISAVEVLQAPGLLGVDELADVGVADIQHRHRGSAAPPALSQNARHGVEHRQERHWAARGSPGAGHHLPPGPQPGKRIPGPAVGLMQRGSLSQHREDRRQRILEREHHAPRQQPQAGARVHQGRGVRQELQPPHRACELLRPAGCRAGPPGLLGLRHAGRGPVHHLPGRLGDPAPFIPQQVPLGQHRDRAHAEPEVIYQTGLLSGAPQFRLDELRPGRPGRSRVSHLAPG